MIGDDMDFRFLFLGAAALAWHRHANPKHAWFGSACDSRAQEKGVATWCAALSISSLLVVLSYAHPPSFLIFVSADGIASSP
jgi:hypothetical protein